MQQVRARPLDRALRKTLLLGRHASPRNSECEVSHARSFAGYEQSLFLRSLCRQQPGSHDSALPRRRSPFERQAAGPSGSRVIVFLPIALTHNSNRAHFEETAKYSISGWKYYPKEKETPTDSLFESSFERQKGKSLFQRFEWIYPYCPLSGTNSKTSFKLR